MYRVELLTGQRFDISVKDLLGSQRHERLANAGYRAYAYEGAGGVESIVQGDDFRLLMSGNMDVMEKG